MSSSVPRSGSSFEVDEFTSASSINTYMNGNSAFSPADYDGTILDASGDEFLPPRFSGASESESGIENGGEMTSLITSQPPTFEPTKKRFMFNFAPRLEVFLACIDDPIIKLCQKASHRIFFFINMALTFAVALEIAVAAPVALYVLGFDAVATEVLYYTLVLATLSQIPKRFIWRYRPFMVHRAQMVKKTTTSSFPSRAVVCATVYAYIISTIIEMYTQSSEKQTGLEWWNLLVFLGLIIIISFARINLGVHYPTDCIAGCALGVLIILVSWGLRHGDRIACNACQNLACYANPADPLTTITYTTLSRVNWIMVGVVASCSILIGVLFIIPPIQFWTKFIRVYGLLLPALFFRLVFICPHSNATGAALAHPDTRPWYAWLFAVAITGVAMAIGALAPKSKVIITYTIFYIVLTAVLCAWRLFILV